MKNSNIIVQALTLYENQWLDNMDYGKNEFETSEKFERKMKKMLKSRNSFYHKVTLTGFRRTVCVIAAILLLMLSSLSVSAVREAISNFFVTNFSNHVVVEYKDINSYTDDSKNSNIPTENTYPKKIEKEYELSYIPKQYELTDYDKTDISVLHIYSSLIDNGYIYLDQFTKDEFSPNIDNETTVMTEEVINNCNYIIFYDEESNVYVFIWENEEYAFQLITMGIDKQEVIKVCESLKIKENQ